jgi:hypothetical protein
MIGGMTRPTHVPVIESHGGAAAPAESSPVAVVDDNVPTTCDRTSDAALGELRREILRRASPILLGAGVAAGRAACQLEPEPTRLNVEFDVPVTVS